LVLQGETIFAKMRPVQNDNGKKDALPSGVGPAVESPSPAVTCPIPSVHVGPLLGRPVTEYRQFFGMVFARMDAGASVVAPLGEAKSAWRTWSRDEDSDWAKDVVLLEGKAEPESSLLH
jgi:hypothetical protein